MQGWLGFLVTGLALCASPGPAPLSLAALGAAFGIGPSRAYFVVNVGIVIVIGLTASGIAGLLRALPGSEPVIATAAGLYFLYLAWRIWTAPPGTDPAPASQSPRFLAGLGLSLVNPKAYAAMAALISGFELVAGSLGLDLAVKSGAAFAIVVAANTAWLLLGAGLTRLYRDATAARRLNRLFALLLMASVLFLVIR